MADFTIGSSKGFNPFLSEADYAPPPVEPTYSSEAQLSNPFLQSFAPEPIETQSSGGGENPFLNYSASPYDYEPEPTLSSAPTSSATNPFADFAIGESTSNAFSAFPEAAPIATTNNGPFAMDWSTNIPAADPPPQQEMLDLMSDNFMDSMPPDMLDMVGECPMRPPPPSVPQSTQDLLDTVTGALEATSDSLLDRLRVTQPSPIPLAPSPSPSPRSPSPDLLGDDPPPAPPPSANPLHPSPHQLDSIIDLFDSSPQPSGPKSSLEILGLYNNISQGAPQRPAPPSAPVIIPIPAEPTEAATAEIIEPKLFEPAEENDKSPAEITPPQPTAVAVDLFFDEPSPVNLVEEVKMEEPIKPIIPVVPKDLPLPKAEPEIVKTVKATPPGRPKPPPAPQRSPVLEAKHPLPTRPPPPVPPAPRISAQPHHPPPPVPPAPVVQTRPPVSPVKPFERPSLPSPHDPFSNSAAFAPAPATIPASEPKSSQLLSDIFAPAPVVNTSAPVVSSDTFEDFDSKFNNVVEGDEVKDAESDPFGMPAVKVTTNDSAWGSGGESGATSGFDDTSLGFGNEQGFDPFLSMTEPPPVPQSTPAKSTKSGSNEDFDREDGDLSIFIKPRSGNESESGFGLAPALAPPPKSPAISTGSAFSEETSAFVPFLSSAHDTTYAEAAQKTQMNRTDSQETPQTPLFEEDTSQPLEEFPRTVYTGDGWEMHMRHPNKKKITGQRFWKKVYVRLAIQNEVPVVQLYNNKTDKDPFQEIPLQPCYSVSDIGAQQFDNYGKIFTVKLQYVFYKERPGVRPGQITKAERITNKLSQFAAYAIQGDYQGVKEFGSDLKKLGLPLEHAPQISQLVKLGTQTFEELKQFSCAVEECLFKMVVHRDRAIQYKTEEVQVTLVDEYYVEQDIYGVVTKQIARVRLYFLSFLSGVAEVEMGINDLRRQGKEVVGRHDIIPIATEEWIRIEDIEFSNCVQLDEFENTKTIKFKPPDACYIELIRFRVRPPKHRELPLQIKAVFTTTGNRVEIRCDVLVPGFTSRKLGQIPCEDVMIRFPIPECWIYMFRVEKHFRYGSVKSAHRRSGKVKGIERFLGAVETVEQSLMEVTSGQAKYEHQHKSIVWRIARLPKDGQGAYTTHSFFCHITLQAHEELPDNLSKYCYVEFTMPHTTISHTVCRSISVPTSEEPPEKCVRYLSRHECIIEIEHTQGITPATYSLAAAVPVKEEPPPEPVKPETKDSDSDFSD